MKRWAIILLAGLTCGFAVTLPAADVSLINVRGAIGPATASYIARAIDLAGDRGDACLVIQLDTPGGLLDSTKDIVAKLYESRVPTVVYVAPAPARAASAGAFIQPGLRVAQTLNPACSIGPGQARFQIKGAHIGQAAILVSLQDHAAAALHFGQFGNRESQ